MRTDIENGPNQPAGASQSAAESLCDLLILSDGTVLAHNLTPAMAAVLNEINPEDAAIRLRVITCEEATTSIKPAPTQPEP